MNDSDNLNTIDSLTMFNTILNIMMVNSDSTKQATLHRIEYKLDLLLKERKNNEDD